jgi:hypothetical protein
MAMGCQVQFDHHLSLSERMVLQSSSSYYFLDVFSSSTEKNSTLELNPTGKFEAEWIVLTSTSREAGPTQQ